MDKNSFSSLVGFYNMPVYSPITLNCNSRNHETWYFHNRTDSTNISAPPYVVGKFSHIKLWEQRHKNDVYQKVSFYFIPADIEESGNLIQPLELRTGCNSFFEQGLSYILAHATAEQLKGNVEIHPVIDKNNNFWVAGAWESYEELFYLPGCGMDLNNDVPEGFWQRVRTTAVQKLKCLRKGRDEFTNVPFAPRFDHLRLDTSSLMATANKYIEELGWDEQTIKLHLNAEFDIASVDHLSKADFLFYTLDLKTLVTQVNKQNSCE